MNREEAIQVLKTVSEPNFKHTNESAAAAFNALTVLKDEKIVAQLAIVCEPTHIHTTESGFVAYNIILHLKKNVSEQNS